MPNASSSIPRNTNSWLDMALMADLPEVNLPTSAHEPFMPNTKDHDFMLDELLRSHKKRMNGFVLDVCSRDSV